MTNLKTTSLMVFGFNIFDIVVSLFFIRIPLLVVSFVVGVVDLGGFFVHLGLKIPLVDASR